MTISIRAEVSDYTNRVLGVIKERFGLKDKSEALDKFVQMFGEEFVPFELKDGVLDDLKRISEKHQRLYADRRMTSEELDMLCEE